MPKDQNNHHFYLAVMHLGDTWTFDEKKGEWVKGFKGTKFPTVAEADSACADANRFGSNEPYVADSKGNQIAVCTFRRGS